ncbi:MAG TPA: alpha/beta fold hydrolase [Puia sp.]|nr:alpha/beta fold hydrolase [Puia sp.]
MDKNCNSSSNKLVEACLVLFGIALIPISLFARNLNDTSHFKPGLPIPTGKYRIATRNFYIVDSSRFDSSGNHFGRNLNFQIWYPAASNHIGSVNYVSPELDRAMVQDKYNNIDSSTLTEWMKLPVNVALNGTSFRGRKFPLLFFLHGFGMSRASYTSIVAQLASDGYIVLSFDSPRSGLMVLPHGQILYTVYDGKPDRKCESMAADASFLLSWVKKNAQTIFGEIRSPIDLNKVGILGHSLGGAAALQACRNDDRFASAVDLDGDPFGKVADSGLKKNTLVLLNEPNYPPERFKEPGSKYSWDSMGLERKNIWLNVFRKNKTVGSYAIRINGTNHFTFTDFPFLTIQYYRNPNAGIIIERLRGLKIITECIESFFTICFEGQKSEKIGAIAANYPETNLYISNQ